MFKKILRVIVFLAVFVGSVVIFSRLMNSEVTESASDLSDPTLPLMCLDINGAKADRLYGYRQEMDASAMREAIIPVTAERTLTVSYKDFGNAIRSVAYEITAPDTKEVVANAKIGNFKADGDYMTASFTLSAPLLMNREYPVRFTLETKSGNVYYYARLLQRSTSYAEEYVRFVYDFYETCLNKNGANGLNIYLETDNTVSRDTFTDISLKSSLDQVTWGSLDPKILRKAVPTIREFNNTTCGLTTDYLISATGEEGETEVYHVTEYYRLRHDTDRMRLLDFERHAEEVFDPAARTVLTTNGLKLGVTTSDVYYQADDSAGILAFVQDDELWLYNSSAQKMTRVFSFHKSTADGDERYDHDDYEIKIIRVTAGGDIDFLVSGYMNRGGYEGRQGVLVCRYLGESSCVEERAFIPDVRSPELLLNDLEKLNYISSGGLVYTYLDGAVCETDPGKNESRTIVSGIHPDCFVSSTDMSSIAWMNEMAPNSSKTLTVMSLDRGTSRTISAPDGSYLRAVGFINDDFIYGEAAEADLRSQVAGGILFAMKKLTIEDIDGATVMTYEKPDILISGITIKSGLIELLRVRRDASGAYVAETTDNIMNNKQTKESGITVKTASGSRQGRTVSLQMPGTVRNLKPVIDEAPIRSSLAGEVIESAGGGSAVPLYYIYNAGTLTEVVTDPAEAVLKADEGHGLALNGEGQYLYERGNKATENEIANEDILEVFKSGELNAVKLQEAADAAGISATVMDLTGCTLEQVLYEVSLGRPVLARTTNGGTALIVGYNRYNTRLYNFETGEHYWYGINDSTAEFAGGGNVFVSYIEPDVTVKGSE